MKRQTIRAILSAITVLSLTGCSSSAASRPNHANESTSYHHVQSAKRAPSILVTSISTLPQAVEGSVLAGKASSLVLVGGYTGVVSTGNAYPLLKSSSQSIKMPFRLHDAAAGFIGENLYVFGGGQANSYNTIVEVANGRSQVVGYLKHPLSDAVCIPWSKDGQLGLLLIGGYDGQTFHRSIDFYSQTGGKLSSETVGTLPVGLRYPSVSALGQKVYISGGKTETGLNDKVYQFSGNGDISMVAKLPSGVQKAASFASDGYVYILGGVEPNGLLSDKIYALNTVNHHLTLVGHLQEPLADMGYFQQSNVGYMAGGITKSGVTNSVFRIHF